MLKTIVTLFLFFSFHANAFAAEPLFAVAVTHTPVLNTPDFKAIFGGKNSKTLKKDSCGQLRSLEFVALPGSVFTVEAEVKYGNKRIFKVSSAEYPYPSKNGYFIDSRSVRLEKSNPSERVSVLPGKEAILTALKRQTGSRYVWGGNSSAGVKELLSWYPPAEGTQLSRGDEDLWALTGVDCSGLLYEATDGYTPRNTSALLKFGKSVSVAGKSLQEITAALEPLDLLVWPGHVMIVIDGNSIIESRLDCNEPDKGVRIRSIPDALNDIMKKRKPADVVKNGTGEFVVRRWY